MNDENGDDGKLTEKHVDEALRDDKYASLPPNLAEAMRKEPAAKNAEQPNSGWKGK